MTTYGAVFSAENYSDDEMVMIDISLSERSGHGVCVCQVPTFLSSAKPEAFVPQCVGLGPYHHKRELMMTKELKLGVATRVLKLKDNTDVIHKILHNVDIDHIQPFYHDVDVRFASDHYDLFTVDGLFLLGLFHSGVTTILEGPHTYFLTGKQGLPLVNAAGVELTMCGVIKDIFMLENQIPTHVLKHVNKGNEEIQPPDEDLGSAMINFCDALSPLVHLNKLPKRPEDHAHLLDLMYHLIAPPVPKPEPETKSQPQTREPLELVVIWIIYSVFMFFLILNGQIFRWVELCLLRRVIPSVDKPSFTNILSSTICLFLYFVSNGEDRYPFLKPYTQIFYGPIKERVRGLFQQRDEAVIPSATELHNTAITFQPTEGSISSVKFNKKKWQFYLPCIRLDVTSEVIIRNLLAYESLTRSNGLIFARFVKLMSALIHTVEDVKLLVDKKIIQTQLSDEVVAQLFNGLRKSVNAGPAKMQKLEQEIKNVKAKFDGERHERKMLKEVNIPLSKCCLFVCLLSSILASEAMRRYIASFIITFSPYLKALYSIWGS